VRPKKQQSSTHSSDINVSGEGQHQVVPDRGSVRRNVGSNDTEGPAESREEHRCPAHKSGYLERVPSVDSVDDLCSRSDHDTKEGTESDKANHQLLSPRGAIDRLTKSGR
jgi:hypothetical protein